MTFGEFIKATRERKQLSHREVARRAGIAPTTLLYIENGQTKDPRLSVLLAILQAIGIRWRPPGGIDDLPQTPGKHEPFTP